MNGKTGLVLAMAGLSVVAMIAVPVWAAGSSGRLMEMTEHMVMHMTGMANAPSMPPRTIHKKVCAPPEGFDPRPIIEAETEGHCRIKNYQKHGDKISLDMICSMPHGTMHGHSVFHSTGSGFTGKTHSKIDSSEFKMTMDATITGKQVGACNYTPPKA